MIELPVGAKVVMVGTQINEGEELIYCWAEIDTSATRLVEEVRFVVVGTGHPVPLNASHVGSLAFQTDRLVFHVYRLHAGQTQPWYQDGDAK